MIIILKVLALRFGQRSHHHDASWPAETNDHNRGPDPLTTLMRGFAVALTSRSPTLDADSHGLPVGSVPEGTDRPGPVRVIGACLSSWSSDSVKPGYGTCDVV
jgi:hypothetical protein